MGTIEAPQREAAADLLARTADLVEAVPGMNVLDAIHAAAGDEAVPASRIGDAYYLLLDYLPVHVDQLGPWADNETSDRVATKVRQLVKTLRNGGPAHVVATPPTPAEEDRVVDIASGRNRGTDHHQARPGPQSPLARLQHERGVVLGAITRAKRAKHPDPHKLTENELRLVRIDEDIAALEDPDYAAELAERREADRQAQDLIAESQAFPADRRPSRSGL